MPKTSTPNAADIAVLRLAASDAAANYITVSRRARNLTNSLEAAERASEMDTDPMSSALHNQTISTIRPLEYAGRVAARNARIDSSVAALTLRRAENAARGTLLRTTSLRATGALRAFLGTHVQAWRSSDSHSTFFYADPTVVPDALKIKGVTRVRAGRDDLRCF